MNTTITKINSKTYEPFTEETIRDHTGDRHFFAGVINPSGHICDQKGVRGYKGHNAKVKWKCITGAPCTITDIISSKNGGYDCDVIFWTTLGVWKTTVHQNVLLTKQVQKLISDMQAHGAICTAKDGRRLNAYFTECLKLRIKEGEQ